MDIKSGDFIWDRNKELENVKKHGVDFSITAKVFSITEERYLLIPNTTKMKTGCFVLVKSLLKS